MTLEMVVGRIVELVSKHGKGTKVEELEGNPTVRVKRVRVEDCKYSLVAMQGRITGITVNVEKNEDQDTVLHCVVMEGVEDESLSVLVDGVLLSGQTKGE